MELSGTSALVYCTSPDINHQKTNAFANQVQLFMGFQKLKSLSRHQATEENGDFLFLDFVFRVRNGLNQLL